MCVLASCTPGERTYFGNRITPHPCLHSAIPRLKPAVSPPSGTSALPIVMAREGLHLPHLRCVLRCMCAVIERSEALRVGERRSQAREGAGSRPVLSPSTAGRRLPRNRRAGHCGCAAAAAAFGGSRENGAVGGGGSGRCRRLPALPTGQRPRFPPPPRRAPALPPASGPARRWRLRTKNPPTFCCRASAAASWARAKVTAFPAISPAAALGARGGRPGRAGEVSAPSAGSVGGRRARG